MHFIYDGQVSQNVCVCDGQAIAKLKRRTYHNHRHNVWAIIELELPTQYQSTYLDHDFINVFLSGNVLVGAQPTKLSIGPILGVWQQLEDVSELKISESWSFCL